MAEQGNDVPFTEGVEIIASDEAEIINGIIPTMTRESQTVAARDGKTVRASHAKSTGLLKGTFSVLPGLSDPLNQRLFAQPQSDPVLMRFAQGTTMRMLSWLLAGTIAAAAAGVPGHARAQAALTPVAQFDHQVTGVAVTPDGRRFVNFPRWTDDAPVSVAELAADGTLRPYPDAEWNGWRNAKASQMSVADHFVCVQSVVADGHGNLWVVDPGAPGNEKILPGAPKLVRIDLKANRVTKVIPIPPEVALQGTYLNDIRFSPDGATGYVTDSGTRGAIIVVDLNSGKSFRALDGQPSTQMEKDVTVTIDGKPLRRPDGRQPAFAADGIAISNDGKTLYYQALTGRTLYAVDTDTLRPEVSEADRAASVRKVATTNVADGLWMSSKGVLYITSPGDDSVKRLDGTAVKPVVTDKRLRWPDTMAEGPDGRIYVTASHIQDTDWFKPGAPASIRTQLFSFAPAH